MANSESGGLNRQTNEFQKETTNIYEDEINLMDYFLVLWKRKYFIVLASVLPALIVGIVFFYSPRTYKVTYVYDVDNWGLSEKNYNLLLSSFYSEENSKRLIDKLRKNGLEDYVKQTKSSDNLQEGLVKFEVFPHFLDITKLNGQELEQLDKIRNMKASLLNITIIGKSREDMYKVSSVILDNIKNIIPLYTARDQSSVCVEEYNNKLANIEGTRFSLQLVLNNINEKLAALRKINSGVAGEKLDNIILQFNVGEQSQYLPLSYQIQAAESKRIELEGNIKVNEENYKYYKDLLALDNRIFAELNGKLSSDYTIEQFKSFLAGLAAINQKPQLNDYLNSYIKKMENISAIRPVVEYPEVYPLAKGTAKKAGTVFSASLVISIFAVLLLEGIRKNKV